MTMTIEKQQKIDELCKTYYKVYPDTPKSEYGVGTNHPYYYDVEADLFVASYHGTFIVTDDGEEKDLTLGL